jgi:hypothetical protein
MLLRRLLHNLLGLLSILVLGAVIWAPFLAVLAGISLEAFGGLAEFRMMGAGAFVALLVVRFVIRPPRPPSRQSIAWGEFAGAIGGTVTVEPPSFDSIGWAGGTTVRWNSGGIPVTLSASRDTDRNEFTHVVADARLAKSFQFHVTPETMIAKVLLSNQLWSIALKAVKEGERRSGSPGAGVAERLAFLGDKEILLGDPMLDKALLVKTDTPALAREFLLDSGVSYCLQELYKSWKGWQLSLMARGPTGEYRLTLMMPGTMLDPQGLDASRKLIEASTRCFADRGFLASSNPKAA